MTRRPNAHNLLWLLALGLAVAGCNSTERRQQGVTMPPRFEEGIVYRSITMDDEPYRYAVYVPPGYTPERAWPAILFLNGAGERGDDGVAQTKVGLGPAILANPERFPCIVVMPQLRPLLTWEDETMTAMAMKCLAAAEAEYNINLNRIALTGLSLGGFGTFHIGALYHDRFCALGPVCGGGDLANAPTLALTPIWCFHGDDDPVVPVTFSRTMVEAVRAAGGDVKYTELPGVGHNAWDAAYGNAEFIEWMLTRQR